MSTPLDPRAGRSGASSQRDFDVEVFYDGDCPLCTAEIRLLRRLDRRQRLRLVDLTRPEFDPATVGVSAEALMRRIHGRLPDGTIIQGVEVLRQLYAAVGFRRLVAISRWPGIAQLLTVAYELFAANRLRLTGRCAGRTCATPSSGRRA